MCGGQYTTLAGVRVRKGLTAGYYYMQDIAVGVVEGRNGDISFISLKFLVFSEPA
jgi:hypothetical protein